MVFSKNILLKSSILFLAISSFSYAENSENKLRVLENKVNYIMQNQKDIKANIKNLNENISVLKNNLSIIENSNNSNKEDITKKIDDFYKSLDEIDTKLLKIETNKLLDASNSNFLKVANENLINNNFKNAQKMFDDYLKNSPKKSNMDAQNLLDLAGTSIAKNELGFTELVYKSFIKRYLNSKEVPEILYNLGMMYLSQGNIYKTKYYFNWLIRAYPKSSYAEDAKDNLSILN